MEILLNLLLIVLPVLLLLAHLKMFEWWSQQYENDV